MDDHDFLPLMEQLKEILLLTEGFQPDGKSEANQLLWEIDWIAERLYAHDSEAGERLALLFTPAGALRGIALDNGWEEIYYDLARIVANAEIKMVI